MAEPLQFINSDTPDDDRPPLYRRGLATILASAPSATGFPGEAYNPNLGRQRYAKHSVFSDSGDDGWREDWEVLTPAQRAFCDYISRRR